jgi:hypothetical protein
VTLASEAKEAEADEFVKDVLLRGFIAGDLAYFEILLGKEGADSAWCPWCKLSHRQWQVIKSCRQTIRNSLYVHLYSYDSFSSLYRKFLMVTIDSLVNYGLLNQSQLLLPMLPHTVSLVSRWIRF